MTKLTTPQVRGFLFYYNRYILFLLILRIIMGKKLTVEDVDIRIFNKHKGNVLRLNRYTDSMSKLKFKCFSCGHIWEAAAISVYSGRTGCPQCAGNLPLTNDKIDSKLFSIGNEIVRVGDYMPHHNNRTHLKWRCLKCNREWDMDVSSILSGKGCSVCSRKQRITNEIIDKRLSSVHNNKVIRIEDHVGNNSTKITWKCIDCGNTWKATPSMVLNEGTGCPHCNKPKNLTDEDIDRKLLEKHEGRIIRLGDTNGIKTKFLAQCNICGHKWYASPGATCYTGTGCPSCSKTGFNPHKSAMLYYIKVKYLDRHLYKIGITGKLNLKARFGSDYTKITVLKTWYFENGEHAYQKEQQILKAYKHESCCRGEKPLTKGGNSELFYSDILNLDNTPLDK